MEKPETSRLLILIIAPPGRIRENLVTIAGWVVKPNFIQTVDTCQQAEGIINSGPPALILVDYRNPGVEMKGEIETIYQNNPQSRIVLLLNRLLPKINITCPAIRTVIYDDISGDTLRQLLYVAG